MELPRVPRRLKRPAKASAKEKEKIITPFDLLRLPRETRCQIISEMRNADQLLSLYESDQADKEGKLHKLIVECTKEVYVDLSSPLIRQTVPFLLVLQNLISVTVKQTLTLVSGFDQVVFIQLAEVAKLKHLKTFIFNIVYDSFPELTFLVNYCFGLTTRIDSKGLVKVQKLNRNLDNVHFVFPDFSLENNQISSSNWKTEFFAIENLSKINGITILDEGMGSINLALENKTDHIEVVQIFGTEFGLETNLEFLFNGAPVRILEMHPGGNIDTEEFVSILRELPVIDTLQEIRIPIFVNVLGDIAQRYPTIHTFVVHILKEDYATAPKKIEKILQNNPQIKDLVIQPDYELIDEEEGDEPEAMEQVKERIERAINKKYHDRIRIDFEGY